MLEPFPRPEEPDMTLTDFLRYLARDRRTASLSLDLADAYRLRTARHLAPVPLPVRSR